jgi:hypothetical protein
MKKAFKLGPIQKAWVRALRSGRYKQTKSALARTNNDGTPKAYCCLGVLCDLAAKKKIVGDVQLNGKRLAFDGNTQDLPLSVVNWAKMHDTLGGLDNELSSLAEANDNGKKFKQIADIIEQRAEVIFRESI